MRMGIGQLAMYPDDPCYDPDRPSWLPYWIDDFTESDCKYNASNILQATGNAAGEAVGAVTGTAASAAGSIIGNAASAAVQNTSISGLAVMGGIAVVVLLLVGFRK